MDANQHRSVDASSADAAVPHATFSALPGPPEEPQTGIGGIEACPELSRRGHLPDIVDPLLPADPDTSVTRTRHLRHDGWTPAKMRLFLERFAECGVITEACQAAGMSARSAYNLRDRDPLFAAGWDAATFKAKPRLADEVFSRSMNGVVERIYKDGVVVAERHRYDNRLTMAALTRLDSRLDRAEERGEAPLNVAARWDEYLAALGEDRRDDGMALLAPPEPEAAEPAEPAEPASPADLHDRAGYRELHELHHGEEPPIVGDPHDVWEDEGRWWTNYPPPPDFDGEEEAEYEDEENYRRSLTPEEQAVIDAQQEAEKEEARALGEAQRLAYFFGAARKAGSEPPPAAEGEADAEES
jgi:hypothetical protein